MVDPVLIAEQLTGFQLFLPFPLLTLLSSHKVGKKILTNMCGT